MIANSVFTHVDLSMMGKGLASAYDALVPGGQLVATIFSAPPDHPWRAMPNHAMTPHVSGTSLEAQKRYADGIRECLNSFLAGEPLDRDYIIVEGGRVTSPSYSYAYQT